LRQEEGGGKRCRAIANDTMLHGANSCLNQYGKMRSDGSVRGGRPLETIASRNPSKL
jgi:hypothetical protein